MDATYLGFKKTDVILNLVELYLDDLYIMWLKCDAHIDGRTRMLLIRFHLVTFYSSFFKFIYN